MVLVCTWAFVTSIGGEGDIVGLVCVHSGNGGIQKL